MYILLWEDKHCDAEMLGFKSFDEAYIFAKDKCEDVYEENGIEVDYELTNQMKAVGWLFYAVSYSDTFSMRIEELNEV